MKRTPLQRRSLVCSLILHGAVLGTALILPLFLKACRARKPNPKLMFVEFTVAIPPTPPPADAVSDPEPAPPVPEPPPKDDIPEPASQPKKPEPVKKVEKPKSPKIIKQTNRVVRRGPTPTPKGPTLTDAQIAALLKKGAKIGATTSIPDNLSQQALAAYCNHVHERLYAAWQQPETLKNLPGLATTIRITIEQDGRISGHQKIASSGNTMMDESVLKAVRSVKALRQLPAGCRGPQDLDILFEIAP